MRRQRTLAVSETYPKVKQFLKSKSRNSDQTQKVYSFALSHLQTFLESEYKEYDVETVLIALEEKKINVYDLLDNFVNYLTLRQDASNSNTKLSPSSIRLYVAAVRSYIENKSEIEISPSKFKNKVTMPKKYKRDKEALDAKDVRAILLSCTHDTLKMFLLVLASSALRANEATKLRNCDIDFSVSPTKIRTIAENTKTNQERYSYISNEASKELKKFMDTKYGKVDEYKKYPNHLVFSKRYEKDSIGAINIYRTLHEHFIKLLKKVEKDKRKEGQGIQRRSISFHSLRTYVYTTVNDTTNTQFAEWVLNHSGSTYYAKKESERRELYLKCMPSLTFLDYSLLEATGKDIESKLQQKEKEIQFMSSKIQELEKSQIEGQKATDERINKLMSMYSDPKSGPIRKRLIGLALDNQSKKNTRK